MTVKDLLPWNRPQRPAPAMLDDEPSPFLALHQRMDRLFNDFFQDLDIPTLRGGRSTAWPNVEVTDGDKEVKVVAELPGLDEKDIEITLRDGVLTLRGEKKNERNGSTYSERWHGQFARSLHLSSDVDPDHVSASFQKGVLTITLDKRPETQRDVRRIAINRGD